jgi:hypothetical protein
MDINMKKSLAIGTDNFKVLREKGKYYIDKTLMIKDFIEYDKEVTLITRPRRFGKTLNMTMFREFFDISGDSKRLFKGLNIMDTDYAKSINTVPVIFLTFKNCSGDTLEELCGSFMEALQDEYMRFEEIFCDSTDVDRESNSYYLFYQTYEMLRERKLDTLLLKGSLSALTKAVNIFYGVKPLILIDEYDHPLIKAHEKGFRKEFSELYGGFLGKALKGNDYLGQALITGIQRVVKESIFSGLNNLVTYTVLSEKYSSYFGLTIDETQLILKDFNKELSEELRLYYDGYVFGGRSMYNPWSILYYLDEGELKPYWINTSTNALIKESIQSADSDFMKAFERLIADGEVKVSVNLEASFIELATTRTLWGLLVNSGYLTVTKEYASNRKTLRIPNMEVKEGFRSIVASYTRLSNDKLNELFDALIEQDMDEFLHIYQELVYEYVSVHDVKENGYHMLFMGMAISVSGMYKIISNQEAGDGRPDIVMESLQPELRPHIVIEFKQGENLTRLKQEALNQILDKKYYAKLKGSVICVGLAHSKKKCELVFRNMIVD